MSLLLLAPLFFSKPTLHLLGLLLVPTASAAMVASGPAPYGCAVVATSTSLGAYCVGGSGPPYGLSRFNFANLTWTLLPATATAGTAFPSSGSLVFFESARVYNELCNCIVKTSHIPSLSPGALAPPSQWYGSDAGLLFPVHGSTPEQTEWHFADAKTFPNTTANFTVLWQRIGNVPWETRSCAAGTNPPFQYWFESRADADTPFQLSKLCFRESVGGSTFSMETASWSRSRGWAVISKAKYNTPSLTAYLSAPQGKPLLASESAVPSIIVPMSGGNNAAFSARIGITYNYCSSCSTTPYCTPSECYCAGSCTQASTSSSLYLAFPKFATPSSLAGGCSTQPSLVFSPGPSSISYFCGVSFYYESFPATESILGMTSAILTAPVPTLSLKTYTPFNATTWRLTVSRSCGTPLAPVGGGPFAWTVANPVLNFSTPIAILGLYFVCASEDSGATWAPSISFTVVSAPVPPLATALTMQPTYIRTSLCAATYKVRFLGARVSASIYPNRVSLGAPCGTFYSTPVDVDDQMFPAWPLPSDPLPTIPPSIPACYSTDNGTSWVQQQAVLYVVPSGMGVVNTALSLSPMSINLAPSPTVALTINGATANPTLIPDLYRASLIRTFPLVGAELTCPGPRNAVTITNGPLAFPTPPSIGTYTLCTSLDGELTWTLQPSATVTVTAAPLMSSLHSINPPQSYSSIAGQSTFFGLGPAFLTPLPSSGPMSGAPLYLTLPTLVRVGTSSPIFEVVSNDPVLTVPVFPAGVYPVYLSTDQGANWVQQSITYQVVAPPVDPTPSPLAVASLVSVTPATALVNTRPILTITGQGFVANSSVSVTWNGGTCTNLIIVSAALPVILTCDLPASTSATALNASLIITYFGSVIVDPAGKVISSGGIRTLTYTHRFAYQSGSKFLAPLTANGLLRLPAGPSALWFSVDQDATIELSVVNAAGEPSSLISLGVGQETKGSSSIPLSFPRSLNLRAPAVDICSVVNSSGVIGGACVVVQSKGRASGVMHFKVVRGDPALIQLPAPVPMDFAPRSKLEVTWLSPVTVTSSSLCPFVSKDPFVNMALNMTSWPDPLVGKNVSVLVTISSTMLGFTTDSNITNQTLNFSDEQVQYYSVPNPAFNRTDIFFRIESSSDQYFYIPQPRLIVCSSKLITVSLPADNSLPVNTAGNITLTLDASPVNGTLIVTFTVSRRGYSSCLSGCTIIHTPMVNFTNTSSTSTIVSFMTPDVAAVDDISVLLSGDAADEYVATFQGARTFISIGGNIIVSQRRGDCGTSNTTLIWYYPIFVNMSFAPPPNTVLTIQPVANPFAVFSPSIITISGNELSLVHRLNMTWSSRTTPPNDLSVSFRLGGSAANAFNPVPGQKKDESKPWLLHFGPVLEMICDQDYFGFENNTLRSVVRRGVNISASVVLHQPDWSGCPAITVPLTPRVTNSSGHEVDLLTISPNSLTSSQGDCTKTVVVNVTINPNAELRAYKVEYNTTSEIKAVPASTNIILGKCDPGREPSAGNNCTICSIGTFSVDGQRCRSCGPGRNTSQNTSTSEDQCLCALDRSPSLPRPCMACEEKQYTRGAAMPCKRCPYWLAPVFLYSLLLAASALYGAAHKTHSFIWTYFELSVQTMQVCGLLTVTSPWSEWGSGFAILNLDLRTIFMPCLIRDPFFMQIVRALVPAAAFGSSYAMGVWKRRRNLQYSTLNDFKLIRPARYSRIAWFFAIPVAVWSLENFDCVRDPYSPENSAKYMRFVPSEPCRPSNGRWVLMNIVAACGFAAVCICFPLFALIKALRKKDRVKLWAVVWYVARLALVINAFALAPRSADCLRFGKEENDWPGHRCYFQLIPVGVIASILSVVAALLLRVWGENVVPYLGLSVLSVSYTLISASPFGRKSFVMVGLLIGFITFIALAVHAIYEHRKESARRWQRDIQEAQEEDEASFQFLMPRAILRDVLEPRGDDGLLFGASFAAGLASAAARDSLHPCHGLLLVIKSELERAPADRALAWQPTLTRVALTHHRTLSRAFRQRLQLIADPKRVQLRRPWPEDGRGDERSAASRVLESHLGRITEIATALGDIVDRRPSAGSRAGSRTGAVSSGSAIELQVVAAPSPRIQSGASLASEHDPLGLVQLAAAGLDLVWHGPSGGVKAIDTICRTGFVNLATLNTGWHGRGLYFTHWAQYADYYFLCGGHRPENLTPQGEHALLLSWALVGAAYPVLTRMDRVDDPEHTFHGGYPGYDSHYALVNDGGITCTEYLPNPQAKYDEVMISQESQVLPLAVVFFKLA